MQIDQYETISVERNGAVDTLWLDRPDALNAITTPMVTELRHYFDQLLENDQTRVVLMGGRGKAFCAGLDIKAATDSSVPRPFGAGMGFQGYLAEVYIKMRRCPQPIISMIQGPACGGGFAFALASDVRIAAETAKMNAAFIKLGLSACDMGTSYFLPRLVYVHRFGTYAHRKIYSRRAVSEYEPRLGGGARIRTASNGPALCG